MNEQELADRFSTQIDRILGGESALAVAAEDDLPLLSLGQQLAQLNFQANPTVQAAFQSQLASWFGTPGGSLSTTGLTFTKILLLSIGAMAMIGAGLGLVVLIGYTWTGALFNFTNEDQPPAPAVTQPAPSNSPVIPSPIPATQTPLPATPTPTQPPATSSLKDVLPAATNSIGDTLPGSPLSTPTGTALPATSTPISTPAGNGDDQGDDTSADAPQDDHDRGHGNDPDRYDEDNPGQSQGPSGDAGQGSGSGNAGGGSQGSSGSDHGGGKGDKK